MESPPFSTHSEAPPLSEDSGLLITSGSFSSDSASGWHHITSELQESDFDERSLSLCESTETSERMCGDFFNTVKKGPGKIVLTTIEPPPEFQDSPVPLGESSAAGGGGEGPRKVACEAYERRARFAGPRLLHLSPYRPASRASLTSRLSTSHNSLVTQLAADDSSFITHAISHDTLPPHAAHITDLYNVPFDSDIYAVPVDMVRPNSHLRNKPKKPNRNKKRVKNTLANTCPNVTPLDKAYKPKPVNRHKDVKTKRHSLPSSSCKKSAADSEADSVHLTLREMRKYLHTLYSSSSESECKPAVGAAAARRNKDANSNLFIEDHEHKTTETNNNTGNNTFNTNNKNKKHKEPAAGKDALQSDADDNTVKKPKGGGQKAGKLSPVRILSINLKQSFCNLFRWRRGGSAEAGGEGARVSAGRGSPPAPVRRALPPLPRPPTHDDTATHFATSIQKVKDYGWYWGPISVEAAERVLSSEPDGSFIVRDSSDDHYIFTLTFKLNGLRHVRIEHDQGNFCFGGCTMFKAQTIVEFIENAVETSRSGRYLFFLNLRPVLGPVRVQLLYPVSRFKRVQSLQHMCRFVILKYVRRDLINKLPLPRRLLDYLSATHYYSELLADI